MESLLRQTYQDMEIIIIEDGSTDETRPILQELEASSPLITVIYKDINEGLSAGRNSGMERARGPISDFSTRMTGWKRICWNRFTGRGSGRTRI